MRSSKRGALWRGGKVKKEIPQCHCIIYKLGYIFLSHITFSDNGFIASTLSRQLYGFLIDANARY